VLGAGHFSLAVKTVFLGIDPGVSGAIAGIREATIQVADAPTLTTRGSRREFMLPEMRKLLCTMILGAVSVYALVEDVHPMPREGVVSAGSFMRGVGLWEGLLCGLAIPFSKVRPQAWKREFGIGNQADQKARAVIVAQRLFPSVSLSRKKDHGRAEACLIAEYARRHWSGAMNPKALRPE
jgi:hypothetical protein